MTGSCPTRLNIGSGRTFDEAALNIDISAAAGPDIVADMSRRDLVGLTFETRRFGPVELAAGRFEHIAASHVLEHVPDVVGLMANCLHLLQDGGRMAIRVPYDLSYGAWQDPTHVRGFNERSWLYYTDWHWQIGWEDWRFELVDQQLVLSALGIVLRKGGMTPEEIRQRPRTVDEIGVDLRKRAVTDAERAAGRAASRPHLDRFPELALSTAERPGRRAPFGAGLYLDLLATWTAEIAPGRDLATPVRIAGETLDAGVPGDFLAVGHAADGAVLAGVRASRGAPGRTWIALAADAADAAGRTLARLHLTGEAVRLLAGPADATLPFAPFERLALLAIDADADAVGRLLPLVFDRLAPGGALLVPPAAAGALGRFLELRAVAGDAPAADGAWISWRRAALAA